MGSRSSSAGAVFAVLVASFAVALAAIFLGSAFAQTPVTVTPALPPGLGSGSPPDGQADATGGDRDRRDGQRPAAKRLQIDGQAGGVNSYVRIGPGGSGRNEGQASEDQSTTGRGVPGAGERPSRELFKIGGTLKF
ncbi:MAG: hypothetical protein EPO67_15215 [Reyranella sp.]|nr:MAG: hypothetical protein EPO67_15215 [Reyranella sp.]